MKSKRYYLKNKERIIKKSNQYYHLHKKYKDRYSDVIFYNINIINEDFAYVLGCLCGDASLSIGKNKGPGKLRLSTVDKEFFKKFKNSIERLFNKSISYYEKRNNNHQDVYTTGLVAKPICQSIIVRYGDFKTKTWVIPEDIMKSNDIGIISSFLRGYFDSEGSYINCCVSIQTINKNLYQIKQLLLKLNISSNINILSRKTTKQNIVYKLSISRMSNLKNFNKYVGFTIKRKQVKLNEYFKRQSIIQDLHRTINNADYNMLKYLYFEKGYGKRKIGQIMNINPNQVYTLIKGQRPKNSIITFSIQDLRCL